jgi:outer membrane biogenesis lipoprotein LolB
MKTSLLVMTTVLLAAVFVLFGCKKSTPAAPEKEKAPVTAPAETE